MNLPLGFFFRTTTAADSTEPSVPRLAYKDWPDRQRKVQRDSELCREDIRFHKNVIHWSDGRVLDEIPFRLGMHTSLFNQEKISLGSKRASGERDTTRICSRSTMKKKDVQPVRRFVECALASSSSSSSTTRSNETSSRARMHSIVCFVFIGQSAIAWNRREVVDTRQTTSTNENACRE